MIIVIATVTGPSDFGGPAGPDFAVGPFAEWATAFKHSEELLKNEDISNVQIFTLNAPSVSPTLWTE